MHSLDFPTPTHLTVNKRNTHIPQGKHIFKMSRALFQKCQEVMVKSQSADLKKLMAQLTPCCIYSWLHTSECLIETILDYLFMLLASYPKTMSIYRYPNSSLHMGGKASPNRAHPNNHCQYINYRFFPLGKNSTTEGSKPFFGHQKYLGILPVHINHLHHTDWYPLECHLTGSLMPALYQLTRMNVTDGIFL